MTGRYCCCTPAEDERIKWKRRGNNRHTTTVYEENCAEGSGEWAFLCVCGILNIERWMFHRTHAHVWASVCTRECVRAETSWEWKSRAANMEICGEFIWTYWILSDSNGCEWHFIVLPLNSQLKHFAFRFFSRLFCLTFFLNKWVWQFIFAAITINHFRQLTLKFFLSLWIWRIL